jgi:hypothetical protein
MSILDDALTYIIRATSHYILGLNFTSPKKRQSPMEIKPLRYNKQYYSWELVCHSVKDLVPSPRAMRKAKYISMYS